LFDIRAFKRNGSTVCEMNYIHQVFDIIWCFFQFVPTHKNILSAH
jgi:hypothetical protein